MKRLNRTKIEMMATLNGAGLQITGPDGQVIVRGVLMTDISGVLRVAWLEPGDQEFDPTNPRLALPETAEIPRASRYQIVDRDGDEVAAGDLTDGIGDRVGRTLQMGGFTLRPQ